MKLIDSFAWDTSDPRGGVPGYGNVARGRYACSVPRRLPDGNMSKRIMFYDGSVIPTAEQVNWLVLSDGGQFAWQGLESGFIYENSGTQPIVVGGRAVRGYGQFSFIYVGEDLRWFEDVETYQATEGGWRYVDAGRIVSIGETTGVAPGVRNFTRWADVTVGQGQNGGIVAQLAGDVRRLLVTGGWFNVQLDRQGDAFRMIATGYEQHVTNVWEFNFDELRALPPEPSAPASFHFNHPVLVVPYKDPRHRLPVRYRMEDGSLGAYTEDPDPSAAIARAAAAGQRALIVHDSPEAWDLPAGLRAWDLPMLEAYRLKAESLDESYSRVLGHLRRLLGQWPGDVGLVAQAYRQGGGPGAELWTEDEVMLWLALLPALVNESPRVKVVAPFCVDRANAAYDPATGMVLNPGLKQALDALVAAAGDPAAVKLTPVQVARPPDPAPPPQPPKPAPAPIPSQSEDEDLMLMNNDQYEKAIVIAGDVAYKYLHAAGASSATQDMCRQKAREATDRFKNAADEDKRNPTIQELADNAFVQFAGRVPDFSVLDAYAAECLTLDREFKEQEGLRRR